MPQSIALRASQSDPRCIHHLFEQQTQKAPSATALKFGDSAMTYTDLNERSNRLANRLLALGVQPEQFVAVHLERSIDSVVALLGILKAGAAYIYLDPAFPCNRVSEILDDSKPTLIVTCSSLGASLPNSARILDIHSADIRVESPESPSVRVSPDQVAYVLYTSGSTGRPKGVVGIHRSLVARLIGSPLPDIESADICGLNSSIGFGITASRLFLPLAIGSSVVIISDSDVANVSAFVQVLNSNRVSSIFLSPPLLRAVLSLSPESLALLSGIRSVTVTGSALTPDLVHQFYETLPNAQLVNVYGSAEIGTTAAMRIAQKGQTTDGVSIGWPIANARMYLLDDRMAQVSTGDIGQIFVGADHLAQGYLNQPELTREKFVPDPFLAGGRLYRTGDLGRWLPNGEIQFLGRSDHQVKIRGHRIEPAEIELVLQSHEGILEVAIMPQEFAGDHRLIAYYTSRDGSIMSPQSLRHFVGQQLPAYMIPALFVRIDNMPRTWSGKIDRNALPPCSISGSADGVYEAPRNPTEDALAHVWSQVLMTEPIGVHDNFLDLGGDSLAAARAAMRIEQRFAVTVTVEQIFDQTIAQLAQLCNAT